MIALFPGQGSQHVEMGKKLFDEFSVVKETFEEASDSISTDLRKLCFEGPESDLKLTQNTQPALLTVSIATYRIAQKEFHFQPKLAAGHSLGEYSALVAIGAIPFSDAVQWVRARGQAMQQAVPVGKGSMAAVMGLEDKEVETLCSEASTHAQKESSDEIVEPANFNSPGQVVVSGSTTALNHLESIAKNSEEFKKAKIKPLEVSAPFHCRLMKPASEKMKSLFEGSASQPQTPSCPYIPNVSAEITSDANLVFSSLIEQIDHPVRWTQSMVKALQSGETKAIEFGPGKVLQGLMKRISRAQKISVDSMGVNDVETLKTLEKFL